MKQQTKQEREKARRSRAGRALRALASPESQVRGDSDYYAELGKLSASRRKAKAALKAMRPEDFQ